MNINNFYYYKRIESYFRTSSFKVACIPLSGETISFVILRICNFKKYFNYFGYFGLLKALIAKLLLT